MAADWERYLVVSLTALTVAHWEYCLVVSLVALTVENLGWLLAAWKVVRLGCLLVESRVVLTVGRLDDCLVEKLAIH